MFLRHFHPIVADRRATVRATVTFSHAASSQKKNEKPVTRGAFDQVEGSTDEI